MPGVRAQWVDRHACVAYIEGMADTVMIRIPRELAARIDDVRHASVSREAFIRQLLDKALRAEERRKGRKR
jgi:metal-responsive CopG/Arc/MetJ family transcriptional regulator